MEDLDSLLEDLGRPKSTSQKKPRAPSSRVDLNELEDLMEDLAAPSARSSVIPEPKREPAPVQQQPKAAASSGAEMDDLDALMESLNTSSRASTQVSAQPAQPKAQAAQPKAQPAWNQPAQQQPAQQQSKPAPQASKQMDDLDDLLNNLTPSSAPPPQQQSQPKSQPAQSSYGGGSSSSSSSSGGYGSQPQQQKPVSGGDLDNLLSNLTTQMNDIDADNPASRGTCATCRQPILGEVIQALGKAFHPEHFACGNCRAPLGTGNFYENQGRPNCEKCYRQLFCPRCGHCDEPILDRCITALGKKWHINHFICTQCLKPFEGGNFFERDGRPYCEADFYSVFAPRCASCDQAIRGDCINALGSQWHPECFVCQYCQKAFGSGTFFEHAGKPYCEQHYHLQTGSLCAGCGKSISGRSVNALDKKWHPEHFVCAFCMNPLAGGAFTEQNGKAYCRECHGKLFG
jgi:paxillin